MDADSETEGQPATDDREALHARLHEAMGWPPPRNPDCCNKELAFISAEQQAARAEALREAAGLFESSFWAHHELLKRMHAVHGNAVDGHPLATTPAAPQASAQPWRVGRSVGRTLYVGATPPAPDLSHRWLERFRADGWTVAIHNDYRLNGRTMTFWLLTHEASGRFVKGEGATDTEALSEAGAAIARLAALPKDEGGR
jgi:hypothetical protein